MKAIEQHFPVVLFIMLYGGSNVWFCGRKPKVWPLKWKLFEQYFPVNVYSSFLKKQAEMF